jgi:hypothetical protein
MVNQKDVETEEDLGRYGRNECPYHETEEKKILHCMSYYPTAILSKFYSVQNT